MGEVYYKMWYFATYLAQASYRICSCLSYTARSPHVVPVNGARLGQLPLILVQLLNNGSRHMSRSTFVIRVMDNPRYGLGFGDDFWH